MDIEVTVKLFAAYQEAYNQPELQLTLTSETTVQDLLEKILQEKPQLEQWRDVTRFGVNLQFVAGNTLLNDGDEIVLIPPVSGG